MNKQPKPHRRHRGVAIWLRVEPLPGATFDFNDKGTMIPRKPRRDEIERFYHYAGGYPADTLKDCMQTINEIWQACQDRGIDQETFVEVMNNE